MSIITPIDISPSLAPLSSPDPLPGLNPTIKRNLHDDPHPLYVATQYWQSDDKKELGLDKKQALVSNGWIQRHA